MKPFLFFFFLPLQATNSSSPDRQEDSVRRETPADSQEVLREDTQQEVLSTPFDKKKSMQEVLCCFCSEVITYGLI
ncbi:hypothetical protein CesoFtcFv8_011846 [Champsocephalus esox]|uniref:Hepcidin n=1 Tax=Champsocephalus esox TaxID=159716 RepID=A0AAN8GX57_9TELE|nr:hypothetical protein CesoFtcFv8_011846 [Champsocephalus esox]